MHLFFELAHPNDEVIIDKEVEKIYTKTIKNNIEEENIL